MNDDTTLRSIASGSYVGKPSLHMIFSVFPFNFLLVVLYTIAPIIDWYGVVIVGSNTFFPMFAAYYMIKGQESKLQKIIIVLCFYTFLAKIYSIFFVDVTFTATSMLIAVCCFILFFCQRTKYRDIIIILGLLLSYGIRPSSFYTVGILLLPAWLFKGCNDKELLMKDLILLIKIAVSIAICMIIQNVFINDKSQQEYLKYNEYRSLFYDYYYGTVLELPEEEQKEIFDNAGFDNDERKVLCAYGAYAFYDGIPEKMEALITQIEQHGIKKNNYIPFCIKSIYINQNAKIYFCIVCLACYFVFKSKKIKKILSLLMLLGFENIVLLYIAYNGRMPDRVIVPLFMAYSLVLVAMVLFEDNPREVVKKLLSCDSVLCCILVSLFFVNTTMKVDGFLEAREYCKINNSILNYFFEHPDNVYFYNANELDTVSIKNKYMANNYLSMTGWTIFSKANNQKLARYNVSTYKELAFKDNAYFVTGGEFVPESYGLDEENISYELVDTYKNYNIYKVSKNKGEYNEE